ncbi:MAG: Putative DNA-binding protein in cluster with Type I restriction-modification system [uncultured Campylobacterales bacterium]|uniref:DNA-binding protein in cluster with Type I restriction-modification system n=1 Tax=uncultured Campylobacterales bacterium TaxID=352960 RepID=A0A6S6RXB5_9BACT|nr:MAG: Putative DNA-binding protein in cluster with Type I restriction-modification system [uncultured Campylobacterales bacterium]
MNMNIRNNADVITYNEGEIELNVSINNDTVWLNRHQMSNLFGRDVKTIGKHINNIFKEKELEETPTVAKFAIVQSEGNRDVVRDVEHYNLDVVISVGYRVKSHRGVKFRQWATNILKDYIRSGYTINSEKITNDRFISLEKDVKELKSEFSSISTHIKENSLEVKQGIFYDGQIFEAYKFASDLIKSAKESIVLIDNYIDDTTLTLLSKNQQVQITIYTKTVTKQLKLDIAKYNKQYNQIQIKTINNFHDRFLIIDDIQAYHIGASLKDLGKKVFAFSKMNVELVNKSLN